jgi:hypothetical protein
VEKFVNCTSYSEVRKKKGDKSQTLPFNFALECAVTEVKECKVKMKLNGAYQACLMKLLIPTPVECGWYVNRNISIETAEFAEVLETSLSPYSYIHHQSHVD